MILTKRDKKLLTFLAIVLILYVFAQFFILPALDRSSELEMELQEAEFNRQNLELQIATLPQKEQQNEELTGELNQVVKKYYPLLNSQSVDREITGIILKYGMEIESLVITMPVDPSELEPYVFSTMAQEEVLSQELAAALGAADTEETTETDAEASDTESAAAAAQDQVYAVNVTVECSGTREEMDQMLDYLMNECPAILVYQYTYQEGQQTVTVDDNGELQTQTVSTTLLNLGLQLYMCDQGDEAAAAGQQDGTQMTEGTAPASVQPAEGEPDPEEIARMEATESVTAAETESGVSGESVNAGNEMTSMENGTTENGTVGVSAETE